MPRSPWITERPERRGMRIQLHQLAEDRGLLPEAGRTVWVAEDERDLASALSQMGFAVRLGPAAMGAGTHAWRPSPLVSLIAKSHPPGNVADYGCGAGRDAVYLAMRGWHVTAIDCLPEAIRRAEALARRYDVADRITFQELDLKAHPEPHPAQCHLMIRYFNPDLFALLHGQACAVQTYSEAHRLRTGHPRSPNLVLPADARPRAKYWRDKDPFTFALF